LLFTVKKRIKVTTLVPGELRKFDEKNSKRKKMSEFWVAVVAIILHVANYNLTAQYEFKTRFFTKVL
jgi:hypothetical protein